MARRRDDSLSVQDELRAFIGLREVPIAPRVETLSTTDQDGYVLDRIDLITEDDTVPALLGVPQGEGPFPAVLVMHQHGGQRHLGKSEVFGLTGGPYQAFGSRLAQAGCIVLAADSVCFEDRRPGGPGTDERADDWDQHYNAMTYRLVSGDTLMRKVLLDSMAALSALLTRPDVDPARVAALGHSYGGTTSLFLTAVDDRVGFGCASGALASYQHSINNGTGIEMAKVIPGFVNRFDMDDVLAAIAPKPFLVVSATEDKYSIDADEIIEATATHRNWSPDHIRVAGGHALDEQRFEAIIDWTLIAVKSPPDRGTPIAKAS